jgi:hypothetical protein
MKFNLIKKILVFIILLVLYSCNKENAFDCIKSTGNIYERPVSTDEFHSISISDNINLIISQGPNEGIMLKAGKNIMPKITFEVKEQVLYVSNKNACNWVRKFENPQVHITVNDLKTIYQDGYGTIHSEGKLSFENFSIQNFSGNGDIDLVLDTENLDVFSRSYASISLSGKVTNFTLNYQYNHGKFHGQELVTENMKIIHLGLNTLNVFPVQSLDLFIGHSGNVVYYNEPAILQSQITSNGQLIRKF